MTEQTTEQLQKWKESAFYWNKHRSVLQKIFEPITEAILEAIILQNAKSVLDIACGAGEPSLTMAASYPEIKMVSTDPVGEMLSAARNEARRRNLNRLLFCRCRGEKLPFRSKQFDVALCRLGAMFFPDAMSGLQEILRVLQPGGQMALAVWHSRSENPMFSRITDILDRYIPPTPEAPDQPGAFRFAEPGKLARLLGQAGASEVKEDILDFRMEAPVGINDFWTIRSETSDTLRGKLALLTPSELVSLEKEVKAAVQHFFQGGTMSFPAKAIIVSGKRSH